MDFGMDTSALMRILTGQPAELAEKVLDEVGKIIDAGGTLHVFDRCLDSVVVAEELNLCIRCGAGCTVGALEKNLVFQLGPGHPQPHPVMPYKLARRPVGATRASLRHQLSSSSASSMSFVHLTLFPAMYEK